MTNNRPKVPEGLSAEEKLLLSWLPTWCLTCKKISWSYINREVGFSTRCEHCNKQIHIGVAVYAVIRFCADWHSGQTSKLYAIGCIFAEGGITLDHKKLESRKEYKPLVKFRNRETM